jgi:hypothetical protein
MEPALISLDRNRCFGAWVTWLWLCVFGCTILSRPSLPECIRSFARTYSASPIYHDMAAEAMSLVHPLTLLSVYEAEIHCF